LSDEQDEVRETLLVTSVANGKLDLSAEGEHPAESNPSEAETVVTSGLVMSQSNENIVDGEAPESRMVTDIDACLTEDSLENALDPEHGNLDSDRSAESFRLTYTLPDSNTLQPPGASHDSTSAAPTAFRLFDNSYYPPAEAADPEQDNSYVNRAFIHDDNIGAEADVISEETPLPGSLHEESSAVSFCNPAYEDDEGNEYDDRSIQQDGDIVVTYHWNGSMEEVDPFADIPDDAVEEYVDMIIKNAVKELQEHPNSASKSGRWKRKSVSPADAKSSPDQKHLSGSGRSKGNNRSQPATAAPATADRRQEEGKKGCCDRCSIL